MLSFTSSIFFTLLLIFISLTILIFYTHNFRPAIMCFLELYIPFQNMIIPIFFLLLTLSAKEAKIILLMKDVLILSGIIIGVKNFSKIRLNISDLLGLIFLGFLLINFLFSSSDFVSSGYGLRSYVIPLLLFFYGRLSFLSNTNLYNLLIVLFTISLFVMLISLTEYLFFIFGFNSFSYRNNDFLFNLYGHGAPGSAVFSRGFLDKPVMVGTFGNNLIMSAYLRNTLCLFIMFLIEFKKEIRLKHFMFCFFLILSSIVTFSRFSILSIFFILILILFQKDFFPKMAKIVIFVFILISIVLNLNVLSKVLTITINVDDESTYTHIKSIREIKEIEPSFFGKGLGTGSHSEYARKEGKFSEGEGFLRQALPEIGIFGISVFFLFTISIIYYLNFLKEKSKISFTIRTSYFWVTLPIFLELIRVPIDIAIRSFLSSGIIWFYIGAFMTKKEQNSGYEIF